MTRLRINVELLSSVFSGVAGMPSSVLELGRPDCNSGEVEVVVLFPSVLFTFVRGLFSLWEVTEIGNIVLVVV